MKPILLHISCLLFFTILAYLGNCSFCSFADAYTTCNGSIAECYEEGEMLMESEISRRFLEQKKYISYGALGRDRPACDGEGGEAYGKGRCQPGQSNPPGRGCSKYYQCRSG
ncbi:hypothetical protein SLA2020_337280 [Shorea laevis]